MGGGGVVLLERESAFNDRWRRYTIVVDGQKVGKIGDGDVIEIPVDPGSHSLRLRISWTGSPTQDFSIAEGETVRFQCRSLEFDPVGMLLSVLRSLVRHDEWISLERCFDAPLPRE